MRLRHKLAALSLLALSGCASVNVGPVNEAGFGHKAQSEILQSQEKVVVTYTASWNKDDYGFQKINPNGTSFTGVLVLGENHLAFAIWNEERTSYTRLIYLPYSSITGIELEKFGLGRALLIHAGEPYYTLHILRSAAGIEDQEKSEEAYQFIASKAKP